MALSSKESDSTTNQKNGVVIKVYTESVKTRSTKKSEPSFNLRRHVASGTKAYDRRALLHDYSRNLRNSASQNVPMEPKIKTTGVRLNQCSCSSSKEMLSSSTIRSRKEQEESKEGNHSKKRRSRWKNPALLEKMKNMYTQISCKEI